MVLVLKLLHVFCCVCVFKILDFPGGPVVKNLPANAGNTGWIPGPGRSPCYGATKPLCHNH